MKQQIQLLLALVCMFFSSALAGVPDEEQTLAPYFQIIENGSVGESETENFPLQSTDVKVEISGTIADVEVRQVYQNRGKHTIEALYVFPGGTGSAVHGLTLKIGDRIIEAEINERKKAKQKYEEAKSAGKTASLLEQHRPNVFQMNVANILPGDTIEAVLRYTELLKPSEKVYEFVYPTVVGPRYAGDSNASADQWGSNPFLEEGTEDPTGFNIEVRLSAGLPIQDLSCDTHPTSIEFKEASTATIALTADKIGGANRDFILRYRLADRKITSGLLLHEDPEGGENFFLMTVEPPERITPEDLPPREYVFVVDVSGSMNGFPLNTAKDLVEKLIGNLQAGDQFNILAFSGASDSYSDRMVAATEGNLESALRWMNSRKSGGGTELVTALRKAIKMGGAENASRSLVVVTDGYVSFEREAFEVIEKNLGNANLFAFGIGSSVNRYIIEGMARVGRGEPFVVTDPKHAKDQAELFRKYISTPVLTDIEVDFGDFDVYDVEPEFVPDLLADRPVTVFGKWKGKPRGKITVKGSSGEGRITRELEVVAPSAVQPALPYLWARDRIAKLADYKGSADDPELQKEITSLGLTYHLLTEYTSFVAVDETVREIAGEKTKTVKQPLPLPQGVPASAVGGGSTPGPAVIPLLLAAFSALFGRRFLKRKAA